MAWPCAAPAAAAPAESGSGAPADYCAAGEREAEDDVQSEGDADRAAPFYEIDLSANGASPPRGHRPHDGHDEGRTQGGARRRGAPPFGLMRLVRGLMLARECPPPLTVQGGANRRSLVGL
eukprot:5294930-Prymnesium_polylepis.2